MDFWQILIDIVVLLGACLVFGGILAKLGQNPLVGYLIAGMAFAWPGSPYALRAESDIETIAELGVSLLLFSIGLEFSWARLKALGGRALMGGALQVLVTLFVGAVVSLVWGLSVIESIAVGAMVSLSSTACVLRVLLDRAEIDSTHGRGALAILLVQDMAVVPLAVLMTVMGAEATMGMIAFDLGRVLLQAIALIAVLYIVVNKLAVMALERLAGERMRELTVLLAVTVGLGATWAAHEAGISPALGAFVAGMFLGGSSFATQVRADVASLRVILLTLFFGAAGMLADPLWIAENWLLVVCVTASLIVGKTVIIWLLLRALGKPHRQAFATGLCLAQVGEFSLVLAMIGATSGSVSENTGLLIASTTILSLALTPYLVAAAPRIGRWVAERFRATTDGSKSHAHHDPHLQFADGVHASHTGPMIVIIGFGPAGQMAAAALEGAKPPPVIIDVNRDNIRRAHEQGMTGHIGDATQIEVLEHAHIQRADRIVITLPARSTALTVLYHARRLAPQAMLIVRARYQLHKHEFEEAGAHVVVGDEERVGAELANAVTAGRADFDTDR